MLDTVQLILMVWNKLLNAILSTGHKNVRAPYKKQIHWKFFFKVYYPKYVVAFRRVRGDKKILFAPLCVFF
jgi:hypothetical protein